MTTHKEALTLVLAEFENQKAGLEEVGVTDHSLDEFITAIKEALAQPEQEPVADSYSLADKVREALDRQSCPDAFMRIAWETIVKHYTTPPYVATPRQRPSRSDMTWVGLTDEDLTVCGDEDDVMLARYWERVLMEKNK